MKTAFFFPGQGSQKVGMVHDLYEKYDSVKKIIREADDTLGFAILTASVCCWQVLKEEGVTPDVAAGHSLGEYSALVAAGSISFSDAVHTVNLRGKFMQEAVPLGEGSMAAVIGLDPDRITEVCAGVSTESQPVQAVNFNCPGQTVIAGAAGAVEKACAALKEAGAKRAIMLNVSAPFHSSLMEPAAQKLKKVLDKIEIKDAEIPVIANVNTLAETKAADIRTHLVEQAAHAVRWEESVRNLIAGGMDTMVECGPGTVLSGFMRKIDKSIVSYHAENIETIIETVQALKGV